MLSAGLLSIAVICVYFLVPPTVILNHGYLIYRLFFGIFRSFPKGVCNYSHYITVSLMHFRYYFNF